MRRQTFFAFVLLTSVSLILGGPGTANAASKFGEPVPENYIVIHNNLEWVWASPRNCASPGYPACYFGDGWRYATPEEFLNLPDPAAFEMTLTVLWWYGPKCAAPYFDPQYDGCNPRNWDRDGAVTSGDPNAPFWYETLLVRGSAPPPPDSPRIEAFEFRDAIADVPPTEDAVYAGDFLDGNWSWRLHLTNTLPIDVNNASITVSTDLDESLFPNLSVAAFPLTETADILLKGAQPGAPGESLEVRDLERSDVPTSFAPGFHVVREMDPEQVQGGSSSQTVSVKVTPIDDAYDSPNAHIRVSLPGNVTEIFEPNTDDGEILNEAVINQGGAFWMIHQVILGKEYEFKATMTVQIPGQSPAEHKPAVQVEMTAHGENNPENQETPTESRTSIAISEINLGGQGQLLFQVDEEVYWRFRVQEDWIVNFAQDSDGDGVADPDDNCTFVANGDQNGDQIDTDGDGSGDACDPDDDGDGIDDTDDNCPVDANADQADFDGDGIGDVCDPDVDGDEVANGDDACGATTTPEGVPTKGLGTNRWAQIDGDTEFDTKQPKGKGSGRSFSTADTAGCSCEQIIAACGYGQGHSKHGCSNSVMDWWTGLYDRAGEAQLQCKDD